MAHVKRTKNPIAKVLRYFKAQTFKNKKAYTRKGRKASREAKFFSLGDW
jgi:hypothetical protein